MSAVRALVFDFDGLILETEASCFAAWQALFHARGQDYTQEEYLRILGSGDTPRDLFAQRCGAPADWDALERERRTHEDQLNAHLRPQPGVVALLDQARALGLKVGVASSSSHVWVDGHLQAQGLFERFETIVCKGDVPQVKPAPDLYLEAVRRLGVAPAEALAIEDSFTGSLAAKRAGLWCVVVPSAMTRTQQIPHVDLVLPTLEEVRLDELLARFA